MVVTPTGIVDNFVSEMSPANALSIAYTVSGISGISFRLIHLLYMLVITFNFGDMEALVSFVQPSKADIAVSKFAAFDISGASNSSEASWHTPSATVTDAGKAGDIIIGGMDHDLRTLNYLKDGTLYVAQVQNCYDMGYKLIWNAVKTIDGETVDEVTDVGSTSVYADDADNYITMLYGEDADTDAE